MVWMSLVARIPSPPVELHEYEHAEQRLIVVLEACDRHIDADRRRVDLAIDQGIGCSAAVFDVDQFDIDAFVGKKPFSCATYNGP